MAFISIEEPLLESKISLAELNDILEGYSHPIDVRQVANKLGITIIEDVHMDKELSGKLENMGGKWYIYVNAFHTEKRKRFTIAHEIAHYVLHAKENAAFKDVSFFRSPDTNKEEAQANDLAARILMPEKAFFDEIKKGNITILGLAEEFNVSGVACEFRAKKLNLIR